MYHLPDFNVHNPPIPEPLPEVPTPARAAIEETELEEVTNAEVGNSAEVARQFLIFDLLAVGRARIL